MALIGVGDTREEGWRRADQILGYSRTSGIVAPQFMNPPGYASAGAERAGHQDERRRVAAPAASRSRDGRNIDPRTMTVEDAIDAGLVFAGTPDEVFDQLRAFYDHVGGFGHLLMMGQGGLLDHDETVANLTLFSKEVLPRVEDLAGRCNEPRNFGQVSAQSAPRNRRNEGQILAWQNRPIRGEMPMWKAPASVLCGCLAALR